MSRRSNIGWAVAAGTIALDQAVKWWLLVSYDIASRHPVEITPFFNLVMTWNRGVSFGLFSDYGDLMRWAPTSIRRTSSRWCRSARW